MQATSRTASNSTPPAGWYPIGQAGSTAEWDGRGWTTRRAADPSIEAAPPWHHRPWAFLTHLWFWLLVGGFVIAAGFGVVANDSPSRWWALPVGIGLAITLSGMVMLLRRHLRYDELSPLPVIITAGVVSGALGVIVASLLEGWLEPHLKAPFALDLWLSGPIEETCKIGIPLLLLVFVPKIFGDPRVGVLTVLISGAVFGVGEGVEYVRGGTGDNSHLLQAMTRPLTELSHPLWAAIAAGAIWLAAHRSGRVVTLAGFLGWLTAAALHSIHDGLASFDSKGSENTVTDQDVASSDLVPEILGLNAFTILVTIIAYLVLRHVLREMVPPSAVLESAPHWRPTLKTWGVPRGQRETLGQHESGASSER